MHKKTLILIFDIMVVHIEKMLKKVNFRDILLLNFFEFNLMFNPRTSFCEFFCFKNDWKYINYSRV